jgi:hypothetical protein
LRPSGRLPVRKSFQNCTFDRSQVQDNDRNERAAVGDADALVKADPSRRSWREILSDIYLMSTCVNYDFHVI